MTGNMRSGTMSFDRLDSRIAVLIAGSLAGMIGLLDYLTGIRLRLFPLYFIPVAIVALTQSRPRAIAGALLVTAIWAVPNYAVDGMPIYLANLTGQGTAFILLAWLVNRLKASLKYQESLALTDPLTGLSNPRAFQTSARIELERQRRSGLALTMAYLDIDDFKRVNESLGHVGADELLSKVANAMSTDLRATDILARMGGDEFALLLPATDVSAAKILLERLQGRVNAATKATRHPVTFSIGAVAFATPPESVDRMLASADSVMYEVKALGKQQVLVRLDSTSRDEAPSPERTSL